MHITRILLEYIKHIINALFHMTLFYILIPNNT